MFLRNTLLDIKLYLCGIILFGLMPICAHAVTSVTLQLRWEPQFQFAGYYMAQAQGFYKEEGLDVKIVPGGPGVNMKEEVLSHRADFAIGNSGLALSFMQGVPLVLLADIFQRSAGVLITRPGYGKSIEILSQRNIALRALQDNPELYAIFNKQGILPGDLNKVLSINYPLEDFISGKADAIHAYLSNEPFYLNKRNVPFEVIDPINYGIDFYGDALFSRLDYVQKNSETVKRFTRASIKGWAYALANIPDTVDYLHQGPASKKDRAHLLFEAAVTKGLIMPDYVPIGHINPSRWEKIADTFKELGLAPINSKLDASFYFSYWSERGERFQYSILLGAFSALFLIVGGFVFWYRIVNIRLKASIQDKDELILKVEKVASFDSLTGLPNRRLFLDRLNQAIKWASRTSTFIAVVYIDLDRFKEVNDSLGHNGGDEFLKIIATRLASGLRESDTVARFGGDEFVVLLCNLSKPENVELIIQEFVRKITQATSIQGNILYPSASFGISIYPTDGDQAETLLKNSDQAMFAAKSQGTSNYHFFTQALQIKSSYRLKIATELREALQLQQFEMVYQPIVRLSDGRILHAESLIRWRLSSGEILMPSNFITIAEETGLIVEIGDWVFNEVLHFLQSITHDDVSIAVNISPAQLNSPKHSALSWHEKIQEAKILPRRLVFEVTESMMMFKSHLVSSKIKILQQGGCLFSLDDFGTGYSSLASLKNLEFDFIKIDLQFIKELHRDARDKSLVSAMLAMAKGLGLQTIAEGVETVEQVRLLKEMGCDFAQGYYYSKPVSAEEFKDMLSKSNHD